jgi:hypothetical protein
MKFKVAAVLFTVALVSGLLPGPARAGSITFENHTASDVDLSFSSIYCDGLFKSFTLAKRSRQKMSLPDSCVGATISRKLSDGSFGLNEGLSCPSTLGEIGKTDNHYRLLNCSGQPIDGCWQGIKSEWTCN